jgi:flagellar assembly protein FliH
MSSSAEFNPALVVPVMALEYRDLGAFPASGSAAGRPHGTRFTDANGNSTVDGMLSKTEADERIKLAKAEGALQARQEYEQKLEAVRSSIAAALRTFETERAEYYARVEAEIVQLALAIAAKILHREAQVDPMLVAALVRMAAEKMRDGSSVTVRVGTGNGKRWKEFFDRQSGSARIDVVEDEGLSVNDCMLETELGSTNFGLDSQLKEVERGFFDLLALRPVSR